MMLSTAQTMYGIAGMLINELWIGKDVEGSGHGLI
jgi:hypothetical protein